ncbi:MAG: protoheme IX farnesyltransferase, partial [Candidatus Rokubacteria bacterium]|nr:protoheme IX farnesyltransferase [Candidatus Rokubacteria bacterium]
KGEARTARSILLNTVGLLASSLLPFALGMLGWVYLVLGVLLGGGLLLTRNLQLARRPGDRRLALTNFHASNLFLLLLFLAVVIDVVARR